MRKGWVAAAAAVIVLSLWTVASAKHEHEKLPPGPIRDRHELMKGIGDNAKVIGDAVKAGKVEGVADAADKIHAKAQMITELFPPGSTDPKSRAKPEIWTHWPKFEDGVKQLSTESAALAETAKSGGDVPAAAHKLFGACKNCHDQFRKPEEKKKHS